jgi:VanZ family protein
MPSRAAILRIAGLTSLLAIVALSTVPGSLRPHVLESSRLEHLGAYFAVGGLLAVIAVRARLLWVGAFLTGLAALLEIAQAAIPGRDSNLSDWAVSSLGAWAGVGTIFVAVGVYQYLVPRVGPFLGMKGHAIPELRSAGLQRCK